MRGRHQFFGISAPSGGSITQAPLGPPLAASPKRVGASMAAPASKIGSAGKSRQFIAQPPIGPAPAMIVGAVPAELPPMGAVPAPVPPEAPEDPPPGLLPPPAEQAK